MKFNKFIITIIFGIFVFLLPVVLVNFFVDPYLILRNYNYFKKDLPIEKSRFINAGLIKNYLSEKVLIGTSSSQSFLLENK